MSTQTITDEQVAFFRAHAGWSYDPVTETSEQGRERCARELSAAESAFRADPDVFLIWELDVASDDGEQLYCALLCVDCDADSAQVIRGYDSRDGIFERPGRVVAALGGVNLHGGADPYKRVIAAELYAEFEAEREAAIVRADN